MQYRSSTGGGASRSRQHSTRVSGPGTTRTTALLAVLAVVVVSAATHMMGSRKGESSTFQQSRLSYPAYQVPQLEPALLAARAPADVAFHRDPFSFDTARPAAPLPRPPRPVQQQSAVTPAAKPAPTPDTQRSPSFPWQYLGYLGPDGYLVAVFRSDDRQVQVAPVGHVVAGSFRLEEVTAESVTLSVLEDHGELITVPLAKD